MAGHAVPPHGGCDRPFRSKRTCFALLRRDQFADFGLNTVRDGRGFGQLAFREKNADELSVHVEPGNCPERAAVAKGLCIALVIDAVAEEADAILAGTGCLTVAARVRLLLPHLAD